MSDFSDKINELLSNPDSLAQIMQVAKSLGLGQTGGASPPPAGQQSESQAQPSAQSDTAQADAVETSAQVGSEQPKGESQSALAPSQNSLGALGSLLSSGGAKNILNSATPSASSDRRIALLNALRPFISEAKQKRVDNVISAITISSTLGKFKGV